MQVIHQSPLLNAAGFARLAEACENATRDGKPWAVAVSKDGKEAVLTDDSSTVDVKEFVVLAVAYPRK